jgi:hypothetical protein
MAQIIILQTIKAVIILLSSSLQSRPFSYQLKHHVFLKCRTCDVLLVCRTIGLCSIHVPGIPMHGEHFSGMTSEQNNRNLVPMHHQESLLVFEFKVLVGWFIGKWEEGRWLNPQSTMDGSSVQVLFIYSSLLSLCNHSGYERSTPPFFLTTNTHLDTPAEPRKLGNQPLGKTLL